MKDFIKNLFIINDDSLDDSHVVCIMKIYAMIGTLVHTLFALLFIFFGYNIFALVEALYIIVLILTLIFHDKFSAYWVSMQILLPSMLLIAIYVIFLDWNFGYHLYIMLATPVLVYLKYKNKKVRLGIEILTGFLYVALFAYSMFFGSYKIATPTSMMVIFCILNSLKVFYSLYLYMFATKLTTEKFINKLNADKDLLDKDSKIDHLTGLYNRRSMEKFLNTLVDQYHITNKTFGMLLLDIDFFKKVNDTYGHLAGDKVLAEISRLVVYTLRKSDSVFRYGGEEFLAIIPGVQNKKEALEIANAIREDVQNLNIDIDGKDINVTISCGVTLYDGLEMAENIQRVDDALYKSKNNGRNRAEFL